MELPIELHTTTSCAVKYAMFRSRRDSTLENLISSYKPQVISYRAALTTTTCRTSDNDKVQQIMVGFATTYDLLRVPSIQQ